MTILIFIHGTGVRQTGYDATLQSIKDGVANAGRKDVHRSGCSLGS